MKAQDYQISSEKFVFHKTEGNIHDNKLETKPISYFKDALHRFTRNKASILATVIIGILVLFAILGPIVSPYNVAYEDPNYAFARPKVQIFRDLGIHFWDGGTQKNDVNKATVDLYRGIEEELKREVIMTEIVEKTEIYMKKEKTTYSFRLDTYNAVGATFETLTYDEYKALQEYQDEKQIQVILPITDFKLRPKAEQDTKNANIWYRTKLGAGRKTEIVFADEAKTQFIPIYQACNGKDDYTSTMYEANEDGSRKYNYARLTDNNTQYEVRVDYKEYYVYKHYLTGDNIDEPCFIFGANHAGKDIFTCLAGGARFSFVLAVIVATVNLIVGAIYGAIEGYYGGKVDLIMERIVDILASIPFMIVITLLKYHYDVKDVVILFIAFFLTGWTGMAARTRMQFYRFKNQEYVLVARTLGAKDRRIMFKHIFPNAIGTLITGSVLVIPSVIFSETSLSYLGIINLDTGDMTSVGTLLSKGQEYLFTYPHMILFPAVFISLLMLSFNLFGNGLRDAFNPSLRGTEE